jgi:hypothetical protein
LREKERGKKEEKTESEGGETEANKRGMKVVLHVYDVTNSDSEKTNNTILQINRIFKDRIGIGGIFHSAIQVFYFFLSFEFS